MIHHVIYVPGLGDQRSLGQPTILRAWRFFGLQAHYFAMQWYAEENFDSRLQKLTAKIDELNKHGDYVSLVGVSAGASAVLNAFAMRKNINGIVLICGKVNNPQSIGPKIYKEHPNFQESMHKVQASLAKLGKAERSRIMSIHPMHDGTVPVSDTIIPGALEFLVPTRGHIFSIFYCIVFRPRTISNFLNKLRS